MGWVLPQHPVTFGLDLKALVAIVIISVSIWQENLSVMVEPEMLKYLQLLEKILSQTSNE